ncbi:MAG: SphA family protein [Syntrophobacteraceae bacterium]
MKKFFMAVCVCLAVLMAVSAASAEELWDWHLRGADEGLAAGALPPAGLYFINDFYWTGNWKAYGNAGTTNAAAKLNSYVDVPILLWNPGMCPILGATYACAIAEPFDYTTLRLNEEGPLSLTGSQWGAYNTILVPFILSWEIPCNLHVSAAFDIGMNDGTTSPGNSLAANNQNPADLLASKRTVGGVPANVYAWSSTNAYSFTPVVGISWLYGGWNVSAEFQYTFWTKDTDCDYQNGNELASDYTLTYTMDKWTFGLGAEGEMQTGNDKGMTDLGYTYLPGTSAVNWTAGPIVGYNFGPCSLLFTYNFALLTKNDVGGDWAMMRLVVPLGDPCEWYK